MSYDFDVVVDKPPSFALRTIHQIEITSRCNLRCKYCPSPNLGREKLDMTEENFKASLKLIRHLMRKGTQDGEVNLAGIGESTLHPKFTLFVEMARLILGPQMRLVLATNGLLFTEELARAIQPHKVQVFVSLHRPERAGRAIEVAKRFGMLAGASTDPSLAAINWAGQVNWHHSAAPMDCKWVKQGWAMVMADGRLTSCSMDASAIGVFGSVDDDPESLRTKPYGLCKSCHQELRIAGYDQRGAA